MTNWNLIIAIAVPVAIFAAVIIRRGNRGVVDPTQLLLDPDLIGRVRTLAQADRKIQAIKLLRDGTPGLGLAAAKLMVDRMAAAAAVRPAVPAPVDPPQVQLVKSNAVDDGNLVSAADLLPSSSPVPLDVELAARSLKSAGQLIQAVKLVRPHTSNLGEAKAYVDGL